MMLATKYFSRCLMLLAVFVITPAQADALDDILEIVMKTVELQVLLINAAQCRFAMTLDPGNVVSKGSNLAACVAETVSAVL